MAGVFGKIADKNKLVMLDDPVEDGTPVVFRPSQVWAAIRPLPPTGFQEEKNTHTVAIWFHPQVTYNTRISYNDGLTTRQLFVRGIQDVNEDHRELILLCEEVRTP